MPGRKKTPAEIEAEVLLRSGRRCCFCFGLQSDFGTKTGQIAHLDRDPSNANIDNLCWMCLTHHDEYDTKRSQSKGLTIHEAKEYRRRLYADVSLAQSVQIASDVQSRGLSVPVLRFAHVDSGNVTKTALGTDVQVSGPGIWLSDRDLMGPGPSPALTILVAPTRRRSQRCLQIRCASQGGFVMHVEVCAPNDWSMNGFEYVLRGKSDIWVLRGQPIRGDDRDPMHQDRDSIVIFRQADGANRMVISSYGPSGASYQVHAAYADAVALALIEYLDTNGLLGPSGAR